jgi:Zn-dependent M16 (insulinase) family peptidase
MVEFLSGVDYTRQQKRREELLDVSVEDVRQAAEQWLVKCSDRSTAVLGARQEWVKEPGWTVKDLGMQKEVSNAVKAEAEPVAAVAAV